MRVLVFLLLCLRGDEKLALEHFLVRFTLGPGGFTIKSRVD